MSLWGDFTNAISSAVHGVEHFLGIGNAPQPQAPPPQAAPAPPQPQGPVAQAQAPVPPPPSAPTVNQLSNALTNYYGNNGQLYPSISQQIAQNQQHSAQQVAKTAQQLQQSRPQSAKPSIDLGKLATAAINAVTPGGIENDINSAINYVKNNPLQTAQKANQVLADLPIIGPIHQQAEQLQGANPIPFAAAIAKTGVQSTLGAPIRLAEQPLAAIFSPTGDNTIANANPVINYLTGGPVQAPQEGVRQHGWLGYAGRTAGDVLGTLALVGAALPEGQAATPEEQAAQVQEGIQKIQNTPQPAAEAARSAVVNTPPPSEASSIALDPDNSPLGVQMSRISANYQAPNPLAAVSATTPEEAAQAITRLAKGNDVAADVQGNLLNKAIKQTLDADQRVQLNHYLDGGLTADEVDPKVAAIGDEVTKLNQQALAVRQTVDPGVGAVESYQTRIPTSALRTPEGEPFNTGVPRSIFKNLFGDTYNLNSRFSQARQVMEWNPTDGEGAPVYGTAKSIGLEPLEGEPGVYVDKNGTPYAPRPATQLDIMRSGVQSYEQDAGKVLNQYHTDTMILKNHADAVEALKNNRAFNLTQDIEPPAGYKAIRNVPGLEGYYAPSKVADAIMERLGPAKEPGNILTQAYAKLSRGARNIILTNFVVHPLNIFAQAELAVGAGGDIGGFHFISNLRSAATEISQGSDDYLHFLEQTGADFNYGSASGIVEKISRGIADSDSGKYVDTINPFRLNAQVVGAADRTFTYAAWKTLTDSGVSDSTAADILKKYMGTGRALSEGQAANTFLLFYHWFKTLAGAQATMILHPIENAGAIANLAIMATGYVAVTKAWQKYTGNPRASVRLPGELGFIQQEYEAVRSIMAGDLGRGVVPGILLNHINPIPKELLQQITNHDLFTGSPVVNTNGNPKLGSPNMQRLGHAISNTVAPVQQYGKLFQTDQFSGQPKETAGQAFLKYLGFNNPSKTFGEAEARELQKIVASMDPQTAKDYASIHQHQYDDQGNIVSATWQKSMSDAALRANNPKLLAVETKLALFNAKVNGTGVDPLYQLSPAKQAIVERITASNPDDPNAKLLENANASWLNAFYKQRNDFFKNNPKLGATVPNGQPQPPQATPEVQAVLNQLNNPNVNHSDLVLSSPATQQYLHDREIYDNQKREALGLPDKPVYPMASPEVAQKIIAYNSLPKGTGARSAWYRNAANADAVAYKNAVSQYFNENTALGLGSPASGVSNIATANQAIASGLITVPSTATSTYKRKSSSSSPQKVHFRVPRVENNRKAPRLSYYQPHFHVAGAARARSTVRGPKTTKTKVTA